MAERRRTMALCLVTMALALFLVACSTTPTFSLSGIVFFDRNGNGSPDAGEPGIPQATIRVGSLTATTAADGSYVLPGVPPGEQQVRLSAPGFRFVSLSADAVQAMDEPLALMVAGDTQQHVGLIDGFLTLPFRCCPPFTVQAPLGISVMFDVDRRIGYVRSYDPRHIRPDLSPRPGGDGMIVTDEHEGIDYGFPVGTEVVAAAPGVVKRIAFHDDAGHYVVIDHPYADLQTLYAHLSQVSVAAGQPVSRGQPIARSGDSGIAGEPHLHFGCYVAGESVADPVDPYRDLTNPASQNHWTVDNDPQYPNRGADD